MPDNQNPQISEDAIEGAKQLRRELLKKHTIQLVNDLLVFTETLKIGHKTSLIYLEGHGNARVDRVYASTIEKAYDERFATVIYNTRCAIEQELDLEPNNITYDVVWYRPASTINPQDLFDMIEKRTGWLANMINSL